mgnify:CR=1 FL=1
MLKKLICVATVACLGMTMNCKGLNRNLNVNDSQGGPSYVSLAINTLSTIQAAFNASQGATRENVRNFIAEGYGLSTENDPLVQRIFDILMSNITTTVDIICPSYSEDRKREIVEYQFELAKRSLQHKLASMNPDIDAEVRQQLRDNQNINI